MISAQRATSSAGRSTRYCCASAGEPVEEIALPHRREVPRGRGAIALRDPGDDVFLGAEVAIEAAGTHPGLGADLLHRGLVKARAGKAGLGGGEDFVAAIRLQLGIGPAQEMITR